jgi:RNA polymerase sigma-70 factor (ECF subfamily)
VTKREALAICRKRRHQAAFEELAIDIPAPTVDDPPDRASLRTALATLPDYHREPLIMRFWLEMPIDDIAAALEVPAGTIRSRLHYALRALSHDRHASQDLPD